MKVAPPVARLPEIPEGIARKFREIEVRERDLRKLGIGMRVGTVFLTLMLAAMALDWYLTIFYPPLRYLVTLAAVSVTLFLLFQWQLGLRRRRTALWLADEIDRSNPGRMQERVRTVTELSAGGEGTGASPHLIAKLREEADQLGDTVTAHEIVSRDVLRLPLRLLVGAAIVFALLFVLDVPRGVTLLERFWIPWSDASLTQIELPAGRLTVPRGEEATLRATLSGRVPPRGQVEILSGDGRSDVITLKRAGDSLGYAVKRVKADFSYRFRAGDAQTGWRHVAVADRPKISAVTLKLTPPSYTDLPVVEQSALPRSIRLVEGTRVELGFRSDQDLERLDLITGTGRALRLPITGGWHKLDTELAESLTITPVLTNREGLQNANPLPCALVVYPDKAPTVELLPSSDAWAHDLQETIEISFAATDDFGIAEAEIVLQIVQPGQEPRTETIPVPLNEAQGAKAIAKSVEVDLSKLGIGDGAELSYAVRVKDNRPNPADALAAQAKSGKNEDGEPSGKPGEPSDPNDIEYDMKLLDTDLLGQCQSNFQGLKIGEHVGEYTGEAREKAALEINPVLDRMRALLEAAREQLRPALAPGVTDAVAAVHAAYAHRELERTVVVVAEMNTKSQGTPFAFMGLQLRSIEVSHVGPARAKLAPSVPSKEAVREADYHIGRALALLDELTRVYESAKAEAKAAAIAQEIEKMHHIFVENMAKLLGQKPGSLNPRSRKMLEVSDEYVAALQELMEGMAKQQDLLAELLAEHPDLLAKFLDRASTHARTLRDQLTLLAREQAALTTHYTEMVTLWQNDPALGKSKWRSIIVRDGASVTEFAAELLRKAEIWKPDGVESGKVATRYLERLRGIHRALDHAGPADGSAVAARWGEALEMIGQLEDWATGALRESGDEPLRRYLVLRLRGLDRLEIMQRSQIGRLRALDDGKMNLVLREEQKDLWIRSSELMDKIVRHTMSYRISMPEVLDLALDLEETLRRDVVGNQRQAIDAFVANQLPAGFDRLQDTNRGMADSEEAYDRLLDRIIEKLDAEAEAPEALAELAEVPAPTLEDLIKMLANELTAGEPFGIPLSPLNVVKHSDWPSSGESSPTGSNPSAVADVGAQAQAAKDGSEAVRDKLRELAQVARARQAKLESAAASGTGGSAVLDDWNKLESTVDDSLLQGGEIRPPDKYRTATKRYFEVISRE
ncbi:hypothetical protein BH23VER1_BH23VER1_27380 [soil metagenome]